VTLGSAFLNGPAAAVGLLAGGVLVGWLAAKVLHLPIDRRRRSETGLAPPPEAGPFPVLEKRFEVVRSETAEYTFLDESGRKRTYRSPEEMPPEVRKVFEQVTDWQPKAPGALAPSADDDSQHGAT